MSFIVQLRDLVQLGRIANRSWVVLAAQAVEDNVSYNTTTYDFLTYYKSQKLYNCVTNVSMPGMTR